MVIVRETRVKKFIAAAAVTSVALTGMIIGASSASAAPTRAPASVNAAKPAALAAWKKALLSQPEVTALVGFTPGSVKLVYTYNKPANYSKTWQGTDKNTGNQGGAGVEIDRIKPSDWNAAAKGFVDSFGYTLTSLTNSKMVAHKDTGQTETWVTMYKLNGGYVVTGAYTALSGSTDGADTAETLAAAQAAKAKKAGYGK